MTIGMQIALFAFIFLLVEATFELRSSGSCMAASSTATAISSKINRRHARLHTDDDTHSPTTDTRILPNAVTSMFDLLSVDGGSFDIVASTQTVTSTPLQQSSWYTHLLPIYPSEMPKFLCLSFMMFWIVFIFTMTRDTKDALVITNCGAEAIAFLKVYGVVPAAALFMVAYAQLANVFSTRALFYITVTPFIAFYCLFAFVLYPLRHVLHPMSIPVPSGGLSFAVNLLRYWTFSLYYIVSELWGSAGIPLLFWSCANDVIRIEQVTYCTDESCRGELLPSSIVPPPFDCLAIYTQAKRIYPWISMIGNLGPILSGITMSVVSKHVAAHISNDEAAFEVSLKVLTGAMMVAGGIVGCLHWLTYVLNEREGSTVASSVSSTKSSGSGSKGKSAAVASAVAKVDGKDKEMKRGDKKKKKMSFLESIQVLAADPYLSQVAVMVLSYGLTMEFTEIIWKASVKKAFPIKTDYLGMAALFYISRYPFRTRECFRTCCVSCSWVYHSFIHSPAVGTQRSWVDTAHLWDRLPSS